MAVVYSEQERRMEKVMVSGEVVKAVAGAAAIVLAIIGLAGKAPHGMLSIAGIVLGFGLLLEASSIAAEYRMIRARSPSGTFGGLVFGGGLGVQTLAGIAVIVLGVLTLLGLHPEGMMAVAAIVLGAELVLSSGIMSRFNELRLEPESSEPEQYDSSAIVLGRAAVTVAAGTQVLIGLAAIVLGILAFAFAPMSLELIAMLVVGVSELFSGTAVGGRVASVFVA